MKKKSWNVGDGEANYSVDYIFVGLWLRINVQHNSVLIKEQPNGSSLHEDDNIEWDERPRRSERAREREEPREMDLMMHDP